MKVLVGNPPPLKQSRISTSIIGSLKILAPFMMLVFLVWLSGIYIIECWFKWHENTASLVTAWTIFISLTSAATTSFLSLAETRRQNLIASDEADKRARMRATLDVLAKTQWDQDYIKNRDDFIFLRDSEVPMATWAEKISNPALEKDRFVKRQSIIRALNDYELIALGINEGILDEDTYKLWFRQTLLADWAKSKDFVDRLIEVENKSNLYSQLRLLIEKWEKESK